MIQRPAAIWRDSKSWDLLGLHIPLNATKAGLFVTAKRLSEANPQVWSDRLDGLHGIERRHRRTLVIRCSSSVDVTVLNLCAKRIVLPARTGWHHVQVSQGKNHLVTGPELRVTQVTFKVCNPHPCLF